MNSMYFSKLQIGTAVLFVEKYCQIDVIKIF